MLETENRLHDIIRAGGLAGAAATWAAAVLQVAQAGLLGEAVDQLGRLAVLVAGGQLHGGQLLHGVLVQHQTFVHHHRGRETVLWRRESSQISHTGGQRTEEKKIYLLSHLLKHFQGLCRPLRDKNIKSQFLILLDKNREKTRD